MEEVKAAGIKKATNKTAARETKVSNKSRKGEYLHRRNISPVKSQVSVQKSILENI